MLTKLRLGTHSIPRLTVWREEPGDAQLELSIDEPAFPRGDIRGSGIRPVVESLNACSQAQIHSPFRSELVSGKHATCGHPLDARCGEIAVLIGDNEPFRVDGFTAAIAAKLQQCAQSNPHVPASHNAVVLPFNRNGKRAVSIVMNDRAGLLRNPVHITKDHGHSVPGDLIDLNGLDALCGNHRFGVFGIVQVVDEFIPDQSYGKRLRPAFKLQHQTAAGAVVSMKVSVQIGLRFASKLKLARGGPPKNTNGKRRSGCDLLGAIMPV